MAEFRYDTQLLIEGTNLSESIVNNYISEIFHGDCLLVVGDELLTNVHFHTNKPWDIIKYASTIGEIFDIVIEDMIRQEKGLQG